MYTVTERALTTGTSLLKKVDFWASLKSPFSGERSETYKQRNKTDERETLYPVPSLIFNFSALAGVSLEFCPFFFIFQFQNSIFLDP